MKMAILSIGLLAVSLTICWVAGLVEFTYPRVVPNEPLVHPQKVRSLEGTNLVLEAGEVIGLWIRDPSERSKVEILMDVSNQVSRRGFEVDVNSNANGYLEVFVRWPRKFRDSVPPFTVPIIPQTVGRNYRKSVAFGTYMMTNSQPNGTANRGQPVRLETNQTSSTAGPRR